MNELYNSIALRYKQAVVLTPSPSSAVRISDRFIQALLTEISQFGYTFDGDVVNSLTTLSTDEFLAFRLHLIDELKLMVGAHVKYRPLFKNFPTDIPDDDEYFYKRIVGFVTNLFDIVKDDALPLSCGHLIDTSLFNMDDFGACPICQMQVEETTEAVRPPLTEITPLKVIGLTTKQDIYQIFTNLLAAKRSISEDNKEVIGQLVAQDKNAIAYVPDVIPMKENLALISGLLIEHHPVQAETLLKSYFKTATDVLRLATQLSGGDISLKDHTRFKLSNPNRRLIMGLLDNINNPEPDMLRHRMRWIRLGEVLHIGKKRSCYPNAWQAFDTIRNNASKIETFGSKVEQLVHDINKNPKDVQSQKTLVALLRSRPGEYARRLDWMLTHIADVPGVIRRFRGLVAELTTPMLLQIAAHLGSRKNVQESRYFMPKGNVAKIQVVADTRPALDIGTIQVLCDSINEELVSRFSQLPKLKNVYVDSDLSNYVLPMQQRSASKSLVTIARGSRVALPESKVARLFLYWKENRNTNRVDVDLSATTYDGDWNYINHLSYTCLSGVDGVHSGDIQSAPNGAAEFIDIDINKARAKGIRYVVMNVISYTGQPFNTFECFAGVMGREKAEKGDFYEAKTVKHKFDVAGDTTYNLPLALDLQTNEILWMDIALTTRVFASVERAGGKISAMATVIDSMLDNRPTLWDLISLHMLARAENVSFDFDPDIEYDLTLDESFATQVDEILANWM